MRKYILIFTVLLFLSGHTIAQIVDTKSFISLSMGKLFYLGSENVFFPKGIVNSGISVRADYLHNYLPWLKIGVEGSLLFPGKIKQDNSEFATITTESEKMITAGINFTFFLPYKATGWRNRFRFQIGVAPVIVNYQGSRTVIFDNAVYINGSDQRVYPGIAIKGPSTRLGLSVTPSCEYYMMQRVGIRLSLNSLFTSLKSDQFIQNVTIHSLNLGIFLPISRDKKLNY